MGKVEEFTAYLNEHVFPDFELLAEGQVGVVNSVAA
jgi:hypothetical protein